MSCELHEHAFVESCEQCRGAVALLREAREVVRGHRVVARPAARAVVWSAFEREVEASSSWWSKLAQSPLAAAAGGATAAAAVALVVVMVRGESASQVATEVARGAFVAESRVLNRGEPIAFGEAVEAKQTAALHLGRVEVAAAEGARFRVVENGLELSELALERGALQVYAAELEKVPAFEVVTTDVRVKFVGAEVWIEKNEASTRVVVERGQASLWLKRGQLPITVSAGERYEVPSRAPVPREEAPVKVAEREVPPLTKTVPPIRARVAKEEHAVAAATPDAGTMPGDSARATLAEARAALADDAPRAAALAESVLVHAPKSTIEADALAVLADAERRRGRITEAVELYGRLADHRDGASYAEEALLQRAIIFARTGENEAALAELKRAEARFARGPTAPERASLAASIHLAGGRPDRAADAIERASNVGRSLDLLKRRVEVARALSEHDPDRARRLLTPVTGADVPPELRTRARELLEKIK